MKQNSKYNNHTKDYNEEDLENASLSMRKLLGSLEDNPKVLFVKLNLTGNHSSNSFENGSGYRTRHKPVKVLSSNEAKKKAIEDVKLMYKTVQRMISPSGKLIISGITSNETIVGKNKLVKCKHCNATFPKNVELVDHIACNHPEILLQSCTLCDKKFLMLRGLAQHMVKWHKKNKRKIKSSSSEETSDSLIKTDLDEKEMINEDCTYSAYQTNLNNGLSVDDISEVEVNTYSNEGSLNCSTSLYSLTISSNSSDSFQRDGNIDSANLSLNGRKEFNVPVVSSMHMKNQHSVDEEEDSKFRENVIVSPDQEKLPFKPESDLVLLSNNLKFKEEEPEMMPSSSQNEVLSPKICCSCIDIMRVMKKIFVKREDSKFKCQNCPFCGTYYADNDLEHHVAEAHIICNEEECRSRVILTESQFRKLFMQMEMKCIHFNCNHNSHKNNLKHQECDTTIKIESERVKVESSTKQENSSENNESLLKEENGVSSSNGCIYETSENSFVESKAKVESSEANLSCSVCKEIFHQEQKLLSHLFNFHRLTHPFTCDICFLCYRYMKELRLHTKTHKRDILEKESSPSVIENGLKHEKEESLDVSPQHPQHLEAKAKDLQNLESEAENLQGLESEVDFQLESEVQDLQLESEVQDLQLESNLKQDFHVPEELILLELNPKDSLEESSKSVSDASTIECNFPEINVPSDNATFKNEEKDSPKKKKPIIPCVVEKVEYPVDIHNLYAHLRKMEETAPEVNTLEVEIQNPSTESKDIEVNADLDTIPKMSEDKRISTFCSSPAKQIKKNDFSAVSSEIFDCTLCTKKFNLKKSYSEHMFFMHDAVFDDSVVSDILKPISRARKRKFIEMTENAYTDSSSTNFSHQVLPIDFHKEDRQLNPEKMDSNSTVEDTDSRTCNQCGERYLQVTSYFQHLYEVHGDDSLVHVCDNCNKVLITVNMVNSHLCTLVNTFSCNDCELRFTNGSELKEHNMSTHFETIGPHICQDCKKCFLTKRMMEKHRRIIHSDSYIISLNEEGSKELSQSSEVTDCKIESQVNECIASTMPESIESIKEDTEKFLQKVVSPVKVMTKKNKIDNMSCPICEYEFQNTKRLKAHLIITHSKATDVCLFCNRIFAFGRGVRHILDFHITPTDKTKEYEISWVGDPRQDVKEAIDVLGLKRLEAICFYDDYLTLTDSVSFQCRVCMAIYSAVRYYRNHYINKHEKFCALCGQGFESNEIFRKHVEQVHNSLKHYLWFTETIISTIIQTERSKGNTETFIQIIKRKLDENEVNAASQLLEQMEDDRIASNSIISCQLPEETIEVSAVPSEIPVFISEPSTGPYQEDILEWPEFSMELEVTDNGTVENHNPIYCGNEIFIQDDEKKEYAEEINDTMKTNDSTMCERSFDMPNCIFENPISLDNKSVVDLKENEMLTVIDSCSVDNQMPL